MEASAARSSPVCRELRSRQKSDGSGVAGGNHKVVLELCVRCSMLWLKGNKKNLGQKHMKNSSPTGGRGMASEQPFLCFYHASSVVNITRILNSGNPDFRTSEFPEIRISEIPEN